MGSGKSISKQKQTEKTTNTSSNRKSSEQQSNENILLPSSTSSNNLNEKILQTKQAETLPYTLTNHTTNAFSLERYKQEQTEEEDETTKMNRRRDWLKIIKGDKLEYLIHMIENKQITIGEALDSKNNNIFHTICKHNKHRLLKYMVFIVSELSYNVFSESIFELTNSEKQNVFDICFQYNSIDCLKILFKVGGFSLERKYQKYIGLALSYNSSHALEYIQEKTKVGSNLNFMEINYSYINRFSNNYFKLYLIAANKHLSHDTIDTSQLLTYRFIDPTFLHIPQNIYGSSVGVRNQKEQKIQWLTPLEACKYQRNDDYECYHKDRKPVLFEKISPSNIIQGESMNCYFLAVLQSLSMYPQLVKESFDLSKSKPEIGLYCCRFYSRGEAENVIIDDYLPCREENKQLLYSKFYKNSIWVALLEKAWAKMQGSYFYTEQLLIEDAMECILPYPTEGYWIKDLTSEELINLIQNCITNNYLVVVTTKSNLKEEEASLIRNHAYSLLSLYIQKGYKIIKVKNPWGKNEWQGELQTSSSDKVQQMKKSLGNYFDDEKDGVLNLTLNEFTNIFSYICIQYIKNGYKYQSFRISLKDRKAKYYRFKLTMTTKICLRVVQQKLENSNYQKLEFRLFKLSEDEVNQICYNGQDCWNSQRVTYLQSKSSFIDLQKGEYAIKIKVYKDKEVQDEIEDIVLSCYSSIQINLELLNKNEGKSIDSNFIKSFFNNIKPNQISTYGSVKEGWDKYYRYLLRLENQGKKKITYQSDITLKSNLILANKDVNIINKRQFQIELSPNSFKTIKFKIKEPIKKAKIMIDHSFS